MAAITVVCALGCSVYDSSLLQHASSLSNAGDGGMQPDTDAGGGSTPLPDAGGANAGTTQSIAGTGGVLGSGADSGAADAGDSSGGMGGESAGTGGTGGTSGGTGGTAGASAGAGGAAPKQLAVGKSVTASSQEVGHEATQGNDNNTSTRWCSTDGTFPQWWRVDLGASHALSQVSIQFEHPDRTYYYVIETSSNDAVYTQQRTASGIGAVQTLDFPPSVSARYVRITITSALPVAVNGNGTWASFFELSLTGY